MTVFTKPSIRKPDPEDPMCGPLPEDMVEICQRPPKYMVRPKNPKNRKMSSITVLLLSSAFVLILITAALGLLLIYKQYVIGTKLHYQGFCKVPINLNEYYEEEGLQEINEPENTGINEGFALMDSKLDLKPDPKEKDRATIEWYTLPAIVNIEKKSKGTLQEEFEIGDTMEKIKVIEGDKVYNFVHDFENNLTGIIDSDRCFTMQLRPDFSLEPIAFVLNIEKGNLFDVSLVRTTVTASLPDNSKVFNAMMTDICGDRKRYELKRVKSVIRKRSVQMAPAHYIHFAGKGVQEFEITNMDKILEFEKNHA